MHCKNDRFGDIAPGQQKQCFCEFPIPRKPKICAKEGENCQCPGTGKVFYGSKSSEKNPRATFLEMVDIPYAYKGARANGVTPCKNDFFGDPLPGISKQCYCDGDNWYDQKEIDIDFAQFKAKKDEEEALRQQQLAEAAKKAAEEEAARVTAEAKAAAEAAEAEAKARAAAAIAAEEAARKKAEDEAKAARDAQHKAEMDAQNAAQLAEMEALKAEHQAELDMIKAA
jgi:hypothetical protein